jgi:hypothetical protein
MSCAFISYETLLKRWDGLCIICGEPFSNPNSVTREHIIPRNKGGSNGPGNLSISHYHCNQLRGELSLIEAVTLIKIKRNAMGMNFKSWINCSLPNRPKLGVVTPPKRKVVIEELGPEDIIGD